MAQIGQLAAEIRGRFGEAGLGLDQISALIGAVDGVETFAQALFGRNGLQLVMAVGRAIERGDGYGHRGPLPHRALAAWHRPTGVRHGEAGLVVGFRVEPEVTAVEQVGHGEYGLNGLASVFAIHGHGVHRREQSATGGFEQYHFALALHFGRETDFADVGPAFPIAGRECVEERA